MAMIDEGVLTAIKAAQNHALAVVGLVAAALWWWWAVGLLRKVIAHPFRAALVSGVAFLISVAVVFSYFYYGSARQLKAEGVIDLWEFWPGVLSIPALVGIGVLWVTLAYWLAVDSPRVAIRKTGYLGLFGIGVWVLLFALHLP